MLSIGVILATTEDRATADRLEVSRAYLFNHLPEKSIDRFLLESLPCGCQDQNHAETRQGDGIGGYHCPQKGVGEYKIGPVLDLSLPQGEQDARG